MQITLGGMALRSPVFDLTELDPRLNGILSPGYSEAELRHHVHDLFLSEERAYLKHSSANRASIDLFKSLAHDALGDYQAASIVDIGSGPGTTVFSAAEIFDRAQVVATDLALPLLLELRNYAHRENYSRVSIAQMNAEDMFFADNQADLVLGAFILHHALSLENVLGEVRRVLQPGKKAVFWEPFENGSQILARIFEYWEDMNPYQAEPFRDDVVQGLRIFLADLNRRVGRTKPRELHAAIDDKWIFTESHIRDLATGAGFADCQLRNVYAGNCHVLQMLAKLEIERRGFAWSDVPQWARLKLLDVQSKLSIEFLDANPFCCAIVLTR